MTQGVEALTKVHHGHAMGCLSSPAKLLPPISNSLRDPLSNLEGGGHVEEKGPWGRAGEGSGQEGEGEGWS